MKTLWLRSYSVRNADGTRTRHRTRCCSITSIMFGISITNMVRPRISKSLENQNSHRGFQQQLFRLWFPIQLLLGAMEPLRSRLQLP